MIVTLVSYERIFSLHLPEKCGGKYWIVDDERPINDNRLLGIEADEVSRQWLIKADRFVKFSGKSEGEQSEIYLKEGELYSLRLGKEGVRSFLFVEAFTEDNSTYRKYVFNKDAVLGIGRVPDNQIIVDIPYVSSHHAQLSFCNGNWLLQSNPDSNGTFVNRYRVDGQKALVPGDVVFIFGLKIVIGKDFISINNPQNLVRINTDALSLYKKSEYLDDEKITIDDPEYYYRSPRFLREIEPLDLKVDAPTQKQDGEEAPVLLTLAPSLVMGVASFSTGIITMINSRNNGGSVLQSIPTLITSVSMLIGMLLFPFIMKKREKKRKKEKELERRDKYTKYLNNLRGEIERNKEFQEEILRERNRAILELSSTEDFWERNLWGKTPDQEDFLFLRLGIGNAPLYGNVEFPRERFSIEDDVMRDELFRFQKEERLLIDVPVGVSLVKDRVVGIVGEKNARMNLLNNMLVQIFLMHSYDEVKVICLYEKKDDDLLSYVRYAQHIWDDEKKNRFLAITEEHIRELSIIMGTTIRNRVEESAKKKDKGVFPQYILIAVSKDLANKCAFMDDMLKNAEKSNYAVICAYEETKDLPKECHAVIEVNGKNGLLFDSTTKTGKNSFMQDIVSKENAEILVQRMACRTLDLNKGRYDLPGMLTFMDMYGVGKIDHLNIRQRWIQNDPVKSLKAQIGVDTNGELFYLDLHENFHGPHGLIAGMTGSGKSEFIITYVLSMAINYHPDEVAFVLIDYKGGGLTGAFDTEKYRLPHLAGTITNLDSGSVMRSILSIKSELKRRQVIFNQAREIANEGTMDIYKYQKMYRDGMVSDPLPHLIIISDEFAELKSQQPEFLDQLISTARIGRSLGVHLVLATQKPAGVVNDQIWANSKFKVCLKVQDKADSMDMLKKPDAAGIAETGRFFLQVGYDELFEKGQSAWCGAAYLDEEISGTEPDGNIEVLDELGNVCDQIKEKKNHTKEDHGKQIVRIMEYLDQLAKDENIHERQLWMQDIPEDIRMDDLISKYNYSIEDKNTLCIPIGEVDDPYRQKQDILDIDFSGKGNVLLYGASGSGSELMLNTLLYSAYQLYSPAELNAYLLDFGSETMKLYEDAPHTGGVLCDGDNEKIHNFFNMICEEIKNRKKLLSDYAGELKKYNSSEHDRLPFALIILNNYSHFIENYEEFEDTLIALVREGTKYGIYFVITANSAGAIRYRITQHFQQIYAMQLNDPSDYTSIFGRTGGIVPPPVKGRGIYKNEDIYVFQTAHIVGEDDDLLSYLHSFCDTLKERAGEQRAKPVPMVPPFISAASLREEITDLSHLPLGMAYDSYNYLNLDLSKKNVLMITGEDAGLAARFAAGVLEMTDSVPGIRKMVFNAEMEMADWIDATYNDVQSVDAEMRINELFEIAVERNNDYKDTKGHPNVDMSPILIIINNYAKLRNGLSINVRDNLQEMLCKTEGFCNILFLITDSYKNMSSYNVESWYLERCGGNGIWIGDGVADQMRFNIRRKNSELNRHVDGRTAYYIEHGTAKCMRIILPKSLESEVEDDEE